MNFGSTDRMRRYVICIACAVATALGPFSARLAHAQFNVSSVEGFVGGILVWLADFIFFLVGWVTAKLGSFLDWSVDRFILQMATEVDKIDAIDAMWRIFRDLGNIVFIFLILYAAISFILDTNNASAKRTLVSVVVVALFVNFSLFATKVVIDTSNVVALQFYENIAVYETNEEGQLLTEAGDVTDNPEEANIQEDVNARLSNVVAAQLNLSSVQDGKVIDKVKEDAGQANYEVALARLGGAVFTGIAGFIFGALAVLIIIRFIVLVLLMIASPLAFVTMALPQAEMGKTWWSWLISQSFFAPAVMGMMYVTVYFSTSFKQSLGVNPGTSGNASLMEAIVEPGSNIDILVFYATIVGMLIASLIIAQRMGAVGADKAVSYGNQAVSWVGNKLQGGASTLGSGARSTATALPRYGTREVVGQLNSKLDDTLFGRGGTFERFGKRNIGKQIRDKTTGKVEEFEFGTGKSFEDVEKEREQAQSRLESYDTRQDAIDEFEQANTDGGRKQALNNLTSKERLNLIKQDPENRAKFASESDMKKLEKDDDYSAEDLRKITKHRYNVEDEYDKSDAKQAYDNNNQQAIGTITEDIEQKLQFVSNNEIRDNVELDFQADPQTEEYASNRAKIEAMSESQLESFLENKSQQQKKYINDIKLKGLEEAIGRGTGAVSNYLGGKSDKEIAELLKRADNPNSNINLDNATLLDSDRISPKALMEAGSDLSRGTKQRIIRTMTQNPNTNPDTTDWFINGTGNVDF